MDLAAGDIREAGQRRGRPQRRHRARVACEQRLHVRFGCEVIPQHLSAADREPGCEVLRSETMGARQAGEIGEGGWWAEQSCAAPCRRLDVNDAGASATISMRVRPSVIASTRRARRRALSPAPRPSSRQGIASSNARALETTAGAFKPMLAGPGDRCGCRRGCGSRRRWS